MLVFTSMAPEHTPVATGFVPATRIGLAVGVVVAVVGGWLWTNAQKQMRATPVTVGIDAAALPAPTPAPTPTALTPTTAKAAPVRAELPLKGPVVVHVWLENCADCMSAFEAHARIHDARVLRDIPQVNVAYGSSTPAFAEKYRVNENLVVDRDGSQVVQRFGISSFTTLVLDKHGQLVHRDRPDHEGYVQRIEEAWAMVRAQAQAQAQAADPDAAR